jgi:tight adherence protein C
MELLTVALASGESVYNSINKVISRADGLVANEFSVLVRAIELGSTFEDELQNIAQRLPQQQVIEFCNKLALAMRRGTPLSNLLRDQSQSVRHEVQNQIAKQAGKNETRMMIPLVFLILPVTVLFAIYPSLQLLNIQAI